MLAWLKVTRVRAIDLLLSLYTYKYIKYFNIKDTVVHIVILKLGLADCIDAHWVRYTHLDRVIQNHQLYRQHYGACDTGMINDAINISDINIRDERRTIYRWVVFRVGTCIDNCIFIVNESASSQEKPES